MKLTKKHIIFAIILLISVFSIYLNDPLNMNTSKRDLLIEEQLKQLKENTSVWFNGKEVKYYVGNNREYEWYIDQMNTGVHSNNNCGPSVVVMTLKWLDNDIEETVEEAREMYYPQGQWWSMSTVKSYLSFHNVNYGYVFFENESRSDKEENIEKLKSEIEDNSIVILCVNMGYIPREYSERLRTNRFYDYANGHFIIVKGFVVIDNREYFEVYDPNNLYMTYEDSSPKGKDRYYDATSLSQSATNWCLYGLVIKEKGNKNFTD